ncbi:hypothetical protein V8F44DRAFT_631176 [Aspergillus fumigatus]
MAGLSSLASVAFALPVPYVAPEQASKNYSLLDSSGGLYNPDNDTCILQAHNATATCIYGGRHAYTTATNETISPVALYKIILSLSSPDEVLPANTYINVPQCMQGVFTITAFKSL